MYYDDDRKGECFRKYDSPEESFRDHSDFLRFRDRYRFLFDLEHTDYEGWAHGLKKAGYATDSKYPQKLIRLIEEYELYKYDIQGSVERVLPESPAHIETVKPLSERQSETFHFSLSRQMYSINGVPFVYSLDGESYASIAARYNIFHKEILRYNDLKEDVTLYPGTVVYLQKKKKQAAKGLDKHIVEESGETLDDIARRYAVRLSSLRRMNRFPEGYMPKEGEVIILRK
jgi:LysM repeat protein